MERLESEREERLSLRSFVLSSLFSKAGRRELDFEGVNIARPALEDPLD